jgi:hypothetical protein
MESAISWGRDGSSRGYNLSRNDEQAREQRRVSRYFHDTDGRRERERENAPHEASQRAEVEQVHTIHAQVNCIDPEALELTLDLTWSHIAARGSRFGFSVSLSVSPYRRLHLLVALALQPGLSHAGSSRVTPSLDSARLCRM